MAWADPPSDPPAAELSRQVEQLFEQLDSDQYYRRQEASQRLEQLASRADSAAVLAAAWQQARLRADLSLEARKRLETLAERLPSPASPVAEGTPEEVERLVKQLESDSYSARLGAAERLHGLLENPRLTAPIMLALKRQAQQPDRSPDARRWLELLDDKAHEAWLASDPATWELPAVSDDQLRQWVDELAGGEGLPEAAERTLRRTARRELRDLLARDAEVPRVKAALEAKLAQPGLSSEAAERLQPLADLIPPGLVAEYWLSHTHAGSQYLVIGVPSWGQGAQRPSHFDRIDDSTAHCVSGQNLTAGDYPVDVAIGHPTMEDAFFHLVNLPTPRRRMLYEQWLRRPNAEKLAEITRHTTTRYLERKSPLSESELVVLPHLDAKLMSAFAAEMLLTVEDQPLPRTGALRYGGRPSHHGMLCGALAAVGTKEAVPKLLEALQAERVLPPGPESPYRLDWLAALAIATNDPWPEADTWLAGLVSRNAPLVRGPTEPAQLGATAAALLLERHDQSPAMFGLEMAADHLLEGLRVHGYHYLSADGLETVRRWWATQAAKGDASGSP